MGLTRGDHAKGSDVDHRKKEEHMGGVRFKKIM